MPLKLIITADQESLQELASGLQDDDEVNPADVEFKGSDVPGQAGEPITIAIIAILVAKGVAGGLGTGVGAFAGKKLSESVWKKVTAWHSRHGASAHYAITDDGGEDHPVTFEQVRDNQQSPD